MKRILLGIVVLFILSINLSYAYTVEENREIHQYLVNESLYSSGLFPFEIKEHIGNSLQQTGNYIITGSKEEDNPPRWKDHFWDPDYPNYKSYNIGLYSFFSSSYVKANRLWKTQVISNYKKGNIDEAYYWLGRVAHLLEDAAQPSHVLLDSHGGTWSMSLS